MDGYSIYWHKTGNQHCKCVYRTQSRQVDRTKSQPVDFTYKWMFFSDESHILKQRKQFQWLANICHLTSPLFPSSPCHVACNANVFVPCLLAVLLSSCLQTHIMYQIDKKLICHPVSTAHKPKVLLKENIYGSNQDDGGRGGLSHWSHSTCFDLYLFFFTSYEQSAKLQTMTC